MIKLCRFILLAVALCYVVGCASAGTQRGIGCWYGKDFHGKKTASGEIYNMHSMTAAHRKLPFNTWVRVKDLDSGREVVVRINNRGPFTRGRIIDLSYAAAKKLGIIEKGITPVEVKVIKSPPKKKK